MTLREELVRKVDRYNDESWLATSYKDVTFLLRASADGGAVNLQLHSKLSADVIKRLEDEGIDVVENERNSCILSWS